MGHLKDVLDGRDHWELVELMLGHKVLPGRAMKSPLRDGDHKPSFNVFKGQDGKIRWKDFAMEGGDVYSLARYVYNCDFKEALQKLAVLAGVRNGEIPMPRPSAIVRAANAFKQMTRTRVAYKTRAFNLVDEKFWGQYSVSEKLMNEYGAAACQFFSLIRDDGTETRFIGSERSPMYIYTFMGRAKLYRPFHADRSYRYIGNTGRDDVFGLDRLRRSTNKAKHTIVIGGQKDALTAAANLNVNGIAFNSENMIIPENIMYEIMMLTDGDTFIMYDNDSTGIEQMEKNIQRFPALKPVWTNDYTRFKDLSAMVENQQWDELERLSNHIHGT